MPGLLTMPLRVTRISAHAKATVPNVKNAGEKAREHSSTVSDFLIFLIEPDSIFFIFLRSNS